MRRRMFCKLGLSYLVAQVAVALLWTNPPLAQTQAPDDIIIHSQAWTERKHEDTKFSHKKHAADYQILCDQCHHVYEHGNNVWEEGDPVQKCEACHTITKTGKALKDAPPEEQKLSLYNAFHRNCMHCHKEQAKGPAKCQECHPKKKQGSAPPAQ